MRLRLALATLLLTGCARSCSAPSPPLVFATDEESGDVVFIDPAKAAVVARLAVGKRPRGLVVAPDGKSLYVAVSGSPRAGPGAPEGQLPPPDHNADGIAVVDIAKRALVATLPGGTDPESLDVSPDGTKLYVSNEDAAGLTAVDLTTGKIAGLAKVGEEPEGVTVRPDGKVVFVTSEEGNEVVAVETATMHQLAHIATKTRPRSIVVTPDSLTGFVADELAANVSVIDAMGFSVQADIPITLNSPRFGGPRPMGTALSKDGKWLYVTTGRGGSLAIIDVAARKQVKSFDGVGDRPWGVALSADGQFAYTANGTSHDVSIVNLATGNVDHRISVNGLPWGIAVSR